MGQEYERKLALLYCRWKRHNPKYLLDNMGEASPCRTEKRKAKRRGRGIATDAVLTDRDMGMEPIPTAACSF
jgi:hypothetical protein